MTQIGSTPIFSSIGHKVWPIEIPQFSAQKLKHHPGSELGALEVEFGHLPLGKPDYVLFGGMRNLILPNFKIFYLNPSSYAKVITVLPKHVRVMVLEGGI
jgi:hypothetical protein